VCFRILPLLTPQILNYYILALLQTFEYVFTWINVTIAKFCSLRHQIISSFTSSSSSSFTEIIVHIKFIIYLHFFISNTGFVDSLELKQGCRKEMGQIRPFLVFFLNSLVSVFFIRKKPSLRFSPPFLHFIQVKCKYLVWRLFWPYVLSKHFSNF